MTMSRLAEVKIYLGAITIGVLLAIASSQSGWSLGVSIVALIASSIIYVITTLVRKAGHLRGHLPSSGALAPFVAASSALLSTATTTAPMTIEALSLDDRRIPDRLYWRVRTSRGDHGNGEALLRYVSTQDLIGRNGWALFIELMVMSKRESATETLGDLTAAVLRESLSFLSEGYPLTGIVLSTPQHDMSAPLRSLFYNDLLPSSEYYSYFIPFEKIIDAQFMVLLREHGRQSTDVARPPGWPESVIELDSTK